MTFILLSIQCKIVFYTAEYSENAQDIFASDLNAPPFSE